MRRISMTVIIIMILEVYLLKFFVSANKFDRLITIADMARIVWPISCWAHTIWMTHNLCDKTRYFRKNCFTEEFDESDSNPSLILNPDFNFVS